MSKYTTEVRYICETNAGLKESKGYDDVESIIANSRTKIFSFDYPIYDESYRSVLETKILKHFYTREIGFETVGLWKLKLDTKLNEIMPYYNQLYRSQLLEFNPLYTHDLTRAGNKSTEGDNNGTQDTLAYRDIVSADREDIDTTRNTTQNVQTAEVSRDKYRDTPQGALTDLEADKYLTNARKITDDTTENTTRAETESQGITRSKRVDDDLDERKTSTNEFTNTEQYLEHIYGYMNRDASELLLKYRKTFINIDLQIIDELEELFLHLW